METKIPNAGSGFHLSADRRHIYSIFTVVSANAFLVVILGADVDHCACRICVVGFPCSSGAWSVDLDLRSAWLDANFQYADTTRPRVAELPLVNTDWRIVLYGGNILPLHR